MGKENPKTRWKMQKRLRDRRKWMGGIERELTRRRRKGIDLHR
jgi:hypothetical protein